jgi:hypothetical protein
MDNFRKSFFLSGGYNAHLLFLMVEETGEYKYRADGIGAGMVGNPPFKKTFYRQDC